MGVAGPAAAVSVLAGSFPALVFSTLLFGGGVGAALLGRAAVADMYPPERRGRAVGRLLAAGTFGAVGAPPLVGGIQSLFEDGHAGPFVWPWLVSALFAAVGLACAARLRPDPRDLVPGPAPAAMPSRRRSLGELLSVRPFAVALVSIAVAQALMVGLMGVAPITLRARGGSALGVSIIISLHLAGMFVFSPLVGSSLDRWGRRPSLFAGAALAGAGALLGTVGGSFAVAGAGLFLVGVGWSFAYLGATAVVSDVTSPSERAGGLGFTDLLTSLTAATGALTGGSLLQAAGFDVLGRTLAALVIPVFVLLLFVREIEPGRWRGVADLAVPVASGAPTGASAPDQVPVADAGAGCWLPGTLPAEASGGGVRRE